MKKRPPARSGWFARAAAFPVILLAGSAILFVVLPLAGLAWRSVREQAWSFVSESAVQQALRLSLSTSLTSLVVILVLGTPLAYILARWSFPGRRLIGVLVQLPVVLPPVTAGLALLITFGRRGLLGPELQTLGIRLAFTRTAVIMAQVFVAMPFYVRSAQAGFSMVDRDVEEAALVDGANAWWRFVYITTPLASRSLASGALMSWARALGEFGATILFAGSLRGRTQTMPLLIYATFERDINAAIWTALILVGLAALIMLLMAWVSRDNPAL